MEKDNKSLADFIMKHGEQTQATILMKRPNESNDDFAIRRAVWRCLHDLKKYYETCGNKIDFANLEILRQISKNKIDP